MKVIESRLSGVKLIEPKSFGDHRGFFMESYNEKLFNEFNINEVFIQDNHSLSKEAGVLRGLHYQLESKAQTKLIRVVTGAIYDVIVDVRKGSPTYGEWEGYILSEHNKRQLLVPKGFAHGFCTITENVNVLYKVDELYSPEHDRGIAWDDDDLRIDWPIRNPILSEKDMKHPKLKDADNNFIWERK
ncbi:dTDP-4-dehydrorhamnose 3,5-epimerase [Lederbergia wuyishanensis]|uniref:dTDP-4-dehydrorhamnose 3,5-epimerase n=1 Tax=Lederbergia wuyishanensis TaxID=1347903 RepID=A0ABU0D371_9BACI|nr:dTDP-4-dehydrorhamnose 3,5-epimerase [Lederbergia wuyishanensis]MCJ8007980.1 dTDP-4-dehydrorhamnose 3,5-epimerase [Lederbergia wuyishanensis]MDQ0342850.1 dTDP-4-dehydrorhamnose 3,5-epimerase [Lederbergia wuyishanensis]